MLIGWRPSLVTRSYYCMLFSGAHALGARTDREEGWEEPTVPEPPGPPVPESLGSRVRPP